MPFFDRRTDALGWACNVDRADFFGVDVVVGHVAEPLVRPDFLRGRDFPTGFFVNFAVKGRDRGLARINPAAGQLELRLWALLKCQQNLPVADQDRISSGASGVRNSQVAGLAKSTHFRSMCFCKSGMHQAHPSWTDACSPYMGAVCHPPSA